MLSKLSVFYLLAAVASGVTASARPYLVVFGNSLSDLANIENSTNPVPLWKGRYSNGPVWNEYLAYYNNYTLINYAIGGATSNNTSVGIFTKENITIPSVPDQIEMFTKTFGGKFNSNAIANDIAVIEIGANDLFFGIELEVTNEIDIDAYSSVIVENIIGSINSVIKLGYKKILVTSVPDIKTTPLTLAFSSPGPDNVSKYVTAVNDKLTSAVTSGFSRNDTNYVKLVELDKMMDVVQGPIGQALNITIFDKECYPVVNNTVVSSCNNSDSYFFIDWVHPTTKVHAFLASVIAQVINSTSSFTINDASVEPLIARYNLTAANSRSNFLYNADSYDTGTTKANSYNIKQATANAQSLISAKNGNSTSTNNSSGGSSANNGTTSSNDIASKTQSSATKSSAFSNQIVGAASIITPISALLLFLSLA